MVLFRTFLLNFLPQFSKDDERVHLVSASGDGEDEDVCDLELANYSDKSLGDASGGGLNNFPSWIASLDEFKYETFNIKEKSEFALSFHQISFEILFFTSKTIEKGTG